MKIVPRMGALMVVAALLAAAPAVWAGDCCKKTAEQVHAGKACAKCVEHKCCKDAAAKLAADSKAKPCEKCSAKAKEDKKAS